MMHATRMMLPSAMMRACGHIGANIASLRHGVAQHHFGAKAEKHHQAQSVGIKKKEK